MNETRDFLRSIGLPRGDLNELPTRRSASPTARSTASRSRARRGRAASRPFSRRPTRLDVHVHRVSQGSGVFLLTDAELDEMARCGGRRARRGLALRAAERRLGHLGGGARRRPAASSRRPRGARSRSSPRSTTRAAPPTHGFRSVLIADIGVLSAFARRATRRRCCREDMQAKVSVMLPAANPAAARVLERPRREHDQPARPTCRSPRSPRSAPRSTSRSTSTSRRPTTSAASSACTRSPS